MQCSSTDARGEQPLSRENIAQIDSRWKSEEEGIRDKVRKAGVRSQNPEARRKRLRTTSVL
jgi:hypothetical protein